jgi:hypothetical protein
MPTSNDKRMRATDLTFKGEYLIVRLEDGRELAVPIAWYPRLAAASQKQRKNFEWTGRGTGIHWPEIDEDLEVQGLMEGRRSPELRSISNPVGSWFSSRPSLQRPASIAKGKAAKSSR